MTRDYCSAGVAFCSAVPRFGCFPLPSQHAQSSHGHPWGGAGACSPLPAPARGSPRVLPPRSLPRGRTEMQGKIQPLMKFWNSISLKAIYFTDSQVLLSAFSERVLNPSHCTRPNWSRTKGVGEHPPCTDSLVLLPNPQQQRRVLPPWPDPHRHVHKRPEGSKLKRSACR